jgi:hypothetical protein
MRGWLRPIWRCTSNRTIPIPRQTHTSRAKTVRAQVAAERHLPDGDVPNTTELFNQRGATPGHGLRRVTPISGGPRDGSETPSSIPSSEGYYLGSQIGTSDSAIDADLPIHFRHRKAPTVRVRSQGTTPHARTCAVKA